MARLGDGGDVTDVGGLRQAPPQDPVPLPADAVTTFISRAALRNEMALTIARLMMVILAMVRHVILHGAYVRDLDPKYTLLLALMGVALVYYGWMAATLRNSRRLSLRLRISVVFDAAVMFSLLMPSVIWPAPTQHGIAHFVELYFMVLAAMASGMRLSRKAAWLGSVANGIGILILIVVDEILNRDLITTHWGEHAILAVLFIGACLIGILLSSRIHRLVSDGARHAVDADRARRRMSVYLSEAVAAEALGAEDPRVGGRRQEVAVLFCDLRGFTPYAESQHPEALVSELNAYLDAMVQAIRQENGVVDKFIGDAVMVVFGVPRSFGDAAPRAIRCAAKMRASLAEHNAIRARDGLPPLAHGIGIHYGPAVAGNIGNAERLQYTVIGDVVNLASRLETATKEAGVPVLVSAEAVTAAGGADAEGLPPLKRHGSITVRGREAAVECYTLEEAAAEPPAASETDPPAAQTG
jgi:class 3 adenylate cyclase